MPALRMKSKPGKASLREANGLCVCPKSCKVSKKSCSDFSTTQQTAESDFSSLDFSTDREVVTQDSDCNGAIAKLEQLNDEKGYVEKQVSFLADSSSSGKMEYAHSSPTNLETIFSPILEPGELLNIESVSIDLVGSTCDFGVALLEADESFENKGSRDYQSCSISDFYISDMFIAGLRPDDVTVDDEDATDLMPLTGYKGDESSMLFDVSEKYMMVPLLGSTLITSAIEDTKSHEGGTVDADGSSFYMSIDQMRCYNSESECHSVLDEAECFDPHLFIRTLPDLSDEVSTCQPTASHMEIQKRKSVTLVLDLDETLVHSTLEHCDDADFTFTVFFNMKEHTVYVKKRPYLQTFLERVADMFNVVIFTASQSIYAEQLLDILDPYQKLISRRVYRESCTFSDGTYTKDLTILGVDLAKVAIIDNSPQVFRLQVNNGIPIKSWFDDPSDCALVSLLPFLETLVGADDVRPIIARRFGNKE
ncbi:uncharacterized protein LOC115757007 isoform X1 [Rhodamnia argentea]|uniref:Uncharacterized protein LOC115757007 isoform X1 n=3 Tax=Rhodamnia argentea TaxID=178133 RepID=A0A8B8R2V3_9MYRT|nr:uncharacterized protein LOC115757007 isoform X1 [Rhodamnia argentea]XP_048132800.1 uncharacterized protein LOC115757007 isoform X1 [Rhodamnia argentea]